MSVNKPQYVNDHGKENRISNPGKHSAGNVTGLTLLDFIALPARARLSLTFAGEGHGEGFFSLRKLWYKVFLFNLLLKYNKHL